MTLSCVKYLLKGAKEAVEVDEDDLGLDQVSAAYGFGIGVRWTAFSNSGSWPWLACMYTGRYPSEGAGGLRRHWNTNTRDLRNDVIDMYDILLV